VTRCRGLVLGVVLGAAVFAVAPAPSASAVASSFAVSPPTFDLSARRDERVTETVSLLNRTESPQTVTVDVTNFAPEGEEGQARLTDADTGYALATWMRVSPRRVAIPAKTSQTFNFTITVPSDAEPGGHYGAIVFRAEVAQHSNASGVKVAQEISALVLLKVPGKVRERASVVSFRVAKKSFGSGPVAFEIRIRNTGNVHVKPSGTIRVSDLFGRRVATLEIPSANVLPGSIRRFDSTWNHHWLWGWYKAKVALSYSSARPQLAASTSFFGFPIWIVVIGLLLLILLVTIAYRGRDRFRAAGRALSGRA
jgi:hypothetical protein